MIKFKQHIPAYCSGINAEEFRCRSLDKLLEKEKRYLDNPYHKYVWACGDDETLMISSTSDQYWWVVGNVKGINLTEELPFYLDCYQNKSR
jgi:hypothetical protein